MKKFKNLNLLKLAWLCGVWLLLQPCFATTLTHPFFNNLTPLESRPVRTLPSVCDIPLTDKAVDVQLFAGTSLLSYGEDKTKRVVQNFFYPNLGQELIDILLTPDGNDELAATAGKAVKVLQNITSESHRLGCIVDFGFGLKGDADANSLDDSIYVGLQVPLLLNVSHFYLSTDDRNRLKDYFKQAKDIISAGNTEANEGSLSSEINFEEFKPFLISTQLDPVDFKFSVLSPKYQYERLKIRVGLEAIISIDTLDNAIPSYLSFQRAALAKFNTTGNRNEDLANLVEALLSAGSSVGLKSILAAMYNCRVKSLAQNWGHALGPTLALEYDVQPEKISLFANSRANLFLGQCKKVIMASEGLEQLSQFYVQMDPRAMWQANVGAKINYADWLFWCGYDFFVATEQTVNFVFDAYRDGIDYFANNRLSVSSTKNNFVQQHSIFAGLRRSFCNDCAQVSFGTDVGLNAKFLPKTINFALKLLWNL